MNCGEILTALRVSRKLSQASVSKELNIPKSTLSEYERNIVTPSLDRFFKIITFYGLESLYALYGLEVVDISDYSDASKQKIYSIVQEEKKKRNNNS